MDTQKLKALLKAVECGNLTKAAEELGYTQAGLTHMMNRLEDEVGFKLLHRDKRGVKLTFEGEKLLGSMQTLVRASDRFGQDINELLTKRHSVIRIGTYTSILSQWMPMLINGFKKEVPDVTFEIRDSGLDDIYSEVVNSETDLGFASHQEYPGTEFCHLCRDPLYAVLPYGFTKYEDDPYIPLEVFRGKRFLMPTFGYDKDILRILKSNNIKPVITSTAVGDAGVASLVKMESGVSILPELCIKSVDVSGLVTKPVYPPSYRELGIVVSSERKPGPLIQKFIKYAQSVIAD